MEERAKRIGKFNLIDIIAVLLIVAVGLFAAWKLLVDDSEGSTDTVKVTYVVRCENVAKELYENCLPHIPSPLMASGELVGGQIESVEQRPYYVLGPDGQWVEDPEHVTLYFTATTEVPGGPVMTTKVGTQEVRIGKADHILKSEYIEFNEGIIVDVKWGE